MSEREGEREGFGVGGGARGHTGRGERSRELCLSFPRAAFTVFRLLSLSTLFRICGGPTSHPDCGEREGELYLYNWMVLNCKGVLKMGGWLSSLRMCNKVFPGQRDGDEKEVGSLFIRCPCAVLTGEKLLQP